VSGLAQRQLAGTLEIRRAGGTTFVITFSTQTSRG
jgi:two-component sensor histidine kinase